MTLEKAFEELEVIIEKMNSKEVSLDDSFALYTEGTKLLKYCKYTLIFSNRCDIIVKKYRRCL